MKGNCYQILTGHLSQLVRILKGLYQFFLKALSSQEVRVLSVASKEGKYTMLSREIQQHLASDQESDLLNNSSAIEPMTGQLSGVGPHVESMSSKLDLGVKKKGSVGRYDEQEEMRRNLDPLIFADREFLSEIKDQNELKASSASFIELTTHIGNEKRISKPLKGQSQIDAVRASAVARSNELLYSETRQATTVNEASSYGRAGTVVGQTATRNIGGIMSYVSPSMRSSGYNIIRNTTKSQKPKQSKNQRGAHAFNRTGPDFYSKPAANQDYQIMQRDDSTDIRLPDQGFVSDAKKKHQRQFQIKSGVGRKVMTSYRSGRRNYETMREHSAVVAFRRSKDRERREVLASAYQNNNYVSTSQRRMQKRSSANPTIGQQSMVLHQQQNRDKLLSAWNVGCATSQENGTLRQSYGQFSNTTFDEMSNLKAYAALDVTNPAQASQPINIVESQSSFVNPICEVLQSKKRSHVAGLTAQYRQQMLQEQRVKNMRNQIMNQRAAHSRPKSSSYVAANAARLRQELKTQINMDLQPGAQGNGNIFDHSRRILRKNESEFAGTLATPVQMPAQQNINNLTKDPSVRIQVQSGAHQLGQPKKPVGLTQQQLLQGDESDQIVMQRKQLNQASTTSFLISEPRCETNENGNSPNQSAMKFASCTRGSQKDEDTILSLNVKPMQSAGPRAKTNTSPTPYTRVDSSQDERLCQHANRMIHNKSKKPKELILFTNGDQIKLEIPHNGQQHQQAAQISNVTTNHKRKAAVVMRPAHEMQNQPKKWISATGRKNKAAALPITIHASKTATMRLLAQPRSNAYIRYAEKGATGHNSKKGDSIQTSSIKNQDLETPETQIIKKSNFNRIGGRIGHDTHNQSSTATKQQRPQIQGCIESQHMVQSPLYASVENYAVAQVKSLLDHQTNHHESTTLDKNDIDGPRMQSHNASVGDQINQGTIDHVSPYGDAPEKRTSRLTGRKESQEAGSSTARSYVQFLLGRVEEKNQESGVVSVTEQRSPDLPLRTVSPDIKRESMIEAKHQSNHERSLDNLDATMGTEALTLKVNQLVVSDEPPEGLNMTMQFIRKNMSMQSSINKTGVKDTTYDFNKSMEMSAARKPIVMIRDEQWARRPHSRQASSHSASRALLHPGHTGQSKFHAHCGSRHGQEDNKSSKKSRGTHSQPSHYSASQYSVTRSSKFKGKKTSKVRLDQLSTLSKGNLSQKDQFNLSKIKECTKALGNRHHRSTCKAKKTGTGGPINVKDFVKRPDTKSPHSRLSRPSKSKCFRCSACNQNTIERGSNFTISRMDYPKFVGTKNSSLKGGIWSSRNWKEIEGSTLSRGSVFNRSTPKRPTGLLSSRMSSTNSNYKKILNRPFRIERDLSKYSKELSYNQTQRKVDMFNQTRKGKNMAQMRQRADMVFQVEQKLKREREIIKQMDWCDSDLFDAYRESKLSKKPVQQILQRFAALRTLNGDKMYTDVELQYFMQLIRKKDCKENSDEVKEENNGKIVLEYFNRSLYTLQGLTKLLKIEFHYDKLFKKYETSFTVDTVLILMTRARKLYHAIEMIMTIIKLLEKLKQLEGGPQQNFLSSMRSSTDQIPSVNSPSRTSRTLKESPLIKNLKARIRVHIKSFLAQHTLFPVQFKFGGVDQLMTLKPKLLKAESRLSGGDGRIINLQVGGQESPNSKKNQTVSSNDSHDRSEKKSKGKKSKSVKKRNKGATKSKKSCTIRDSLVGTINNSVGGPISTISVDPV